MTRKLILCFDGTNNKYNADNTNVVKLHAMLDRTQPDQITYYQPGIGTILPLSVVGRFKKKVATLLDLAVATQLEEHASDGYRYLMRTYEPDDEIFIFGFSRGSYTARVVAGMLQKIGLLGRGNEELLPFAWDMYKNGSVVDADGFRDTFSRVIRLKFLGVWDTVSSIGWMWNPQHLPFTANNPTVDIVRHAVALDERRANYVQNLWAHTPPTGQDVLEVWFPGVHCDIGGGYPEPKAGLSKITLKWMVKQAEGAGLRFSAAAKAVWLPAQDTPPHSAPSATAKIHKELRGLWWVAECLPKVIYDPADGFKPRWMFHCGRHRYVAGGSHIHASVFRRRDQVPNYRPPNIPKQYVEVPCDAEATR
jgi:uncharacterized protein (DUF2235 family)